MRKRGVQAAAVATLVVLAAAGCSNASPEPKPLSTSKKSDASPRASQTPTPTPTASASPTKVVQTGGSGTKADAPTKQSAEAFVRTYIERQNKATQTGDFSRIDPMIQQCGICEESKATISAIYKKGGKITGGLFANTVISAGDTWEQNQLQVQVVADETPYKVMDKAGRVTGSGGTEHHTWLYLVSKAGDSWKFVGGRVTK